MAQIKIGSIVRVMLPGYACSLFKVLDKKGGYAIISLLYPHCLTEEEVPEWSGKPYEVKVCDLIAIPVFHLQVSKKLIGKVRDALNNLGYHDYLHLKHELSPRWRDAVDNYEKLCVYGEPDKLIHLTCKYTGESYYAHYISDRYTISHDNNGNIIGPFCNLYIHKICLDPKQDNTPKKRKT